MTRTVWQELRWAARSLQRNPGFSLTVLALLTVTIGTMTSAGAAAYELLRGPLPFGRSDRLVMVWSDLPKSGYPRAPLSGPELQDLRQRSRTLSAIAAMAPGTGTLKSRDQDAAELAMVNSTANLFDVLQAAPAMGRTFVAEDEGEDKPPTVILSWNLWRNQFGGDPGIIGRKIDFSGQWREVIGVMPASFRMAFPPDANIPATPDVWVPFGWHITEEARQRYFIRTVARLQDGSSAANAADEVSGIAAQLRKEYTAYVASGRTLFVVPLGGDLAEPVRVPAVALACGGVFLLLLAYVNLAGLWVARAVSRNHEYGIQQALGASMGRVRVHLLVQALVLSAAGCVLGLAAGWAGLAIFRAIRPPSLSRIDYATLSWPVMLGVVALVVISTLGLALLGQASVTPLAGAAFAHARVDASPRYRMRSTLVVVQVALALVFLVCSALWTRTLLNVLHIDPGFRPEQVLTFRYSINGVGLNWGLETNLFTRRLNDAISAIPGVTAAGTMSHLPYDHLPNWSMTYHAEGGSSDVKREADCRPVSPGFLKAIGGRVIAGRFLSETDDHNAQKVVVIDRTLAERTWPGQDAVGKGIYVGTNAGQPPVLMTVVGVVEHMRYRAIELIVREQLFVPVRQFAYGPWAYVVRTPTDLTTMATLVRARVREVDPRVSLWNIRPLQEYYDEAVAERRFTAMLLVSFAAAALGLAAIGIYGLLAYIVSSRRSELGVRIALGAERRQLAQGVLKESLLWAGIGMVGGTILLLPATSALSTVLYGVTPYDPLSWVAAVGVLILVVVCASWIPAFRAATTDPTLLMKAQ